MLPRENPRKTTATIKFTSQISRGPSSHIDDQHNKCSSIYTQLPKPAISQLARSLDHSETTNHFTRTTLNQNNVTMEAWTRFLIMRIKIINQPFPFPVQQKATSLNCIQRVTLQTSVSLLPSVNEQCSLLKCTKHTQLLFLRPLFSFLSLSSFKVSFLVLAMVVYRYSLLLLGLLAFIAMLLHLTMAGQYHLISISFLFQKDVNF